MNERDKNELRAIRDELMQLSERLQAIDCHEFVVDLDHTSAKIIKIVLGED
jgi:hypothetical protein